jgi:predicted RNA-binding protein with PUA-like domain
VRKGDPVLLYHTGAVKAVVGLAAAASDASEDAVDLAPVRPLARPVTMAEIRKDPRFKTLELVRNSRLSVMPVSPPHRDLLLRLSETPNP